MTCTIYELHKLNATGEKTGWGTEQKFRTTIKIVYLSTYSTG